MHGKNPEKIKQYLLKLQKKKKKNEQIPRTGQSPGTIKRMV